MSSLFRRAVSSSPALLRNSRQVHHVAALEQTLSALSSVEPRRGLEERILTQLAAGEREVLHRSSSAGRPLAALWTAGAVAAVVLCLAGTLAPRWLHAHPGGLPVATVVPRGGAASASPLASGSQATIAHADPLHLLPATTFGAAEARRAPATPVPVGQRHGRSTLTARTAGSSRIARAHQRRRRAAPAAQH